MAWVLGAVIVLILAVAGGLITAWIVANMRAVPNPVAVVSPSPTISATAAVPSPTNAASEPATVAPRFTPTPQPTVEITPEPFVHVVQAGETLISIATAYQVFVDDIVALNGIQNPNRIAVGRELLIPGYGVPPPTKKPR